MVNQGRKKSLLPEVPIIVCSPSMMTSTSLINGNAFPERLRKEIHAAGHKYALILSARTNLISSIESARNDLFEHCKKNLVQYKHSSSTRKDIVFVIYSDGLVYMSNFNMFLYELKAFLDIFSQIICRLIDGNSSPVQGFKKGMVDGEKISGGRLINWIQNISNKTFPAKLKLITLIKRNSTEWISYSVKYRDDLSHYKGIMGLRHMHIPLDIDPLKLTRWSIQVPEMPNGVALLKYSNSICEKLSKFVEEVLSIIPEVKNDLNTTWEQAKKTGNYV